MSTRDEHAHETVADALRMMQNLLTTTLPGRLTLFALQRTEQTDILEITFVLEANPQVTYRYSHVLYHEQYSPQEPRLIISIILGALVERVKTWQKPPVGGVLDLSQY